MFGRILKKARIDEREALDPSAGTYESSLDLLYSDMFAGMLAHNRCAPAIDVPDMIGGIYLGHDETTAYWDAPGLLRKFLWNESIVGWPKWFYHAELHEQLRRKARFLRKRMRRTKGLREVLEDALRYCGTRNFRGRSGKPLMIPEDLLLAMTQRTDLRICHELAKSGLATDRLRTIVTSSTNLD